MPRHRPPQRRSILGQPATKRRDVTDCSPCMRATQPPMSLHQRLASIPASADSQTLCIRVSRRIEKKHIPTKSAKCKRKPDLDSRPCDRTSGWNFAHPICRYLVFGGSGTMSRAREPLLVGIDVGMTCTGEAVTLLWKETELTKLKTRCCIHHKISSCRDGRAADDSKMARKRCCEG